MYRVMEWRKSLLVSGALAGVLVVASPAEAGGFGVREQSTEFQGMSFAGNAAAGGGLSGMFWNPAVAAFAPSGSYSESHFAGVIPDANITGSTSVGGVTLPIGSNGSGEFGSNALVPSSYSSYRLSNELVVALGINSPFGFRTEPENQNWSGQTFARESEIKTFNFNPTVAYRPVSWLAIGAGLQIEYIEATLKNASGVGSAALDVVVEGDDTAFGWTAGINITPFAGTNIGLGYRSSIRHVLEGDISIPGFPGVAAAANGANIEAEATMPEIITLSLRQALSAQWALLGTVEKTNWSNVNKLDIVCAKTDPNPVFCPVGNGQLVRSLELDWHDGWFYSLGLEHEYSSVLILRAGGAWEKSPIQNPSERTLRVPDADRVWASLGATYKFDNAISADLAYSHIWVDDAPIDRTESGLRFVGEAHTDINILSASVKIHYDELFK